jgi:hypothetical protein
MTGDTISLTLDAEDVSFDKFAAVVQRFHRLVTEVSAGVDPMRGIAWDIDALEKGSATVSIRGRSSEAARVEQAVAQVEGVASALQIHAPLEGSSDSVIMAAQALIDAIDAELPELRVQTADADYVLRAGTPLPEPEGVIPLRHKTAYGAVEGRIQTLSSRGSLRFTLYDTLHDRAVTCYLRSDQRELVEGLWGHLAIVEGKVHRDQQTGRPLAVRTITSVHALPEPDPTRWRRARGASVGGTMSPEAAVRKVRDEW